MNPKDAKRFPKTPKDPKEVLPRPEGRETFKEESLEVAGNPRLPPVSRAPPWDQGGPWYHTRPTRKGAPSHIEN